MFLSKDSIEILLDLVEIRLETLQVMDKEDVKELSRLKLCKHELFQKQKYLKKIIVEKIRFLLTLVEKKYQSRKYFSIKFYSALRYVCRRCSCSSTS